MNLSIKRVKNSLIVDVKGELDLKTADKFEEKIKEIISKGFRKVIFNFNEVEFIDSSGIGALLSIYKFLVKNDGVMVITNISPRIRRVLEVAGVLRIIDVYASQKEAVEKLAGGGE